MHHRPWLVFAVILAACGGGPDGDRQVAPDGQEGGVDTVMVELDDYVFGMPSRLPAGEVSFRIRNVGIEEHDMLITTAIGEPPLWRLPARLSPGGSTVETLSLAPGTYQVLCEFAGHIGRGMAMTLTVE